MKIKEESCKRLKEDLDKKESEQNSFIEVKASEMAEVLVEERTNEIKESYLKKETKLTKKVESKIFYKKLRYGSVLIFIVYFLIAGSLLSERFRNNILSLCKGFKNVTTNFYKRNIPNDWRWILGISILLLMLLFIMSLLTYFYYFKEKKRFDTFGKWFMVIPAVPCVMISWTDILQSINFILVWLILQISMPIVRFIIIPFVIAIKNWINYADKKSFVSILCIIVILICIFFGLKAFGNLLSVFR